MLNYLIYLSKKKKIIVINSILFVTITIIFIFFFLKKEYFSQITFLPPAAEQSLSSSLSSIGVDALLGGSMGSSNSEQVEIIFNSKSYKKRIIEKFNLYLNYKLNKDKNRFELAIKKMENTVLMNPIEKGNMGFDKTIGYSITCYHTSPDTACSMTNFAFTILDSAIRTISIDKAHRNRIFVDEQITMNKIKLDSLQNIFNAFQIKYKAYNIPEQLNLSLKAYAQLKATALINELKLKAIDVDFKENTPELQELKKNQRLFQNELIKFEQKESPDVFMSLSLSSKLMPEYTSLIRDLEIQNQIILLLTKELEQAKLQEARNISTLIVIDPPFVSEYKARPKRLLILLALIFIEMSLLFVFLFYSYIIENNRDKIKVFIKKIF